MRRRSEAPTSYPAKGKSVIRYSRNISIVSCPAVILFFLLIQLFIGNIICLLYISDAADDPLPYQFGCLFILQNNKKNPIHTTHHTQSHAIADCKKDCQ
ncbi:hypothetical protein AIY38_22565 [Salmonella enterica]|nr:hypothetical protein AIY38_22565 [Salmonella enterica]